MTTAKWLLLGLMLGFSASSALSCGPAAKACGPKECPFGCCDASGTCQSGTAEAQCGAAGAACSACQLGSRCNFGMCQTIAAGGGGTGGSGGGATGGGSGGGATGGGSGGGVTGGGSGGGVTGGGSGGGVTGGGSGGGVTGGGLGGGTGGGVTGGGTGGGGTSCGPSNCAGCCQSGTCINFPNNAVNSTCGFGGASCQNCTSQGAVCDQSTLSCIFGTGGGGGATGGGAGGGGAVGGGGGTTCTGCLNGATCVPYSTSSTATLTCGGGGAACDNCSGLSTSCQSGNCAPVYPSTGIRGNSRVRLVAGDGVRTGTLEVFANGGWGQVCDDGFGTEEADVVCRDLGFAGATSYLTTRSGNGDFFLLDQVVCLGTETTLIDCAHNPFGDEDCTQGEAIEITCGP